MIKYSGRSSRLTTSGFFGLARLEESEFSSDDVMFDLLEFSYETMGEPSIYGYHSYFNHDHYSFDQEASRVKFTQEVNRIF